MGRNKLMKFAMNAQRRNVVEPGKEMFDQVKKRWHEVFFENNNPIVLELGCGRGEYTTGLAGVYPEKNFIGIDVKGSRFYKGSTYAVENNLLNVAFLRTPVELMGEFFGEGEVDEIWITFCDPRPRDRDEKRRMTGPMFLDIYRKFLKKGGVVHLKHDNKEFVDWTLEVLKNEGINPEVLTYDLYQSTLLVEHYEIQTAYEQKWLAEGIKINYLRFRL